MRSLIGYAIETPASAPCHRGHRGRDYSDLLDRTSEPPPAAAPSVRASSHPFPGALAQLASFALLGAGWKAPAVAVVEHVKRDLESFASAARLASVLLDEPWIAASADGSIGVDWRTAERRLAMTYDADGTVEFFAQSGAVERDGHVFGSADARQWASWLVGGTEPSAAR